MAVLTSDSTKRATLRDVALAAGVGKTTVSAILCGSSSTYPAETRRRIERIAADLNYQPNAAARGLRRSRLDTIGVSLHSVGRPGGNPYADSVLHGIVQAAHDVCYNVTLVHRPWNFDSSSMEGFRADLVDGMVVVAPWEISATPRGLAGLGVPVVAVSVDSTQCGAPSVDVDNYAGTRLAVEHLLQLGHCRIAYLTHAGPHHDALIRLKTFLEVMAEAGLDVPAEYICTHDEKMFARVISEAGMDVPRMPICADDADENKDAACTECASEGRFFDARSLSAFVPVARKLLALPNRPTAIFACDDLVARDVLRAAASLKIDVPGQLSVVGFDDLPEVEWYNPALTTVRQPLAEMGAEATRMLLAILGGEEPKITTHWFEPRLVLRESTARPGG